VFLGYDLNEVAVLSHDDFHEAAVFHDGGDDGVLDLEEVQNAIFSYQCSGLRKGCRNNHNKPVQNKSLQIAKNLPIDKRNNYHIWHEQAIRDIHF
jgi:hypothetical protein